MFCATQWMQSHTTSHLENKEKKESAGSGDAAGMIKGGGYVGARTRQPPLCANTQNKVIYLPQICTNAAYATALTTGHV